MSRIIFFQILIIAFTALVSCGPIEEIPNITESKTEPCNSLNADSIVAEYQRKYSKEGEVNIGELSKKLYVSDTNNNEYAMQYVSCLLLGNKIEPAMKVCDKIIAKDSNYSQAYWNKGIAFMYLSKRDSGYYFFNKAILKNPNWYYYFWRARYYEEDSLYANALTDINEAIKQKPNDLDLKMFRGKYRNFNKDYKGGLQDLLNMPEHRKNDPYVFNAIAYSYLFLKQYELAIENCNKALEIDSNIPDALFIRASAKSNLRMFEESLEDLKKCADLGNSECKINYEKMKEALDNKGTTI